MLGMPQTLKSTKKSPGQKISPSKIAIVTGGGVRVGRCICQSLARAGFDVLVHYHRSKSSAMALEKEILESGRKCASFEADLTLEGDPERLVEKTISLFGRLDLLVNNAALFIGDQASPSDLERMNLLNVEAPKVCSRIALPYLRETRGSIINIADVFGLARFRTHKKYSRTKAKLIEITRETAFELAKHSVRVNAICPGTVLPKETYDAKQVSKLAWAIPLGRIGRPEDVAEAVCFLAEADFVTGQVLSVDGGLALKMKRGEKNEKTNA